MAEYLRKCIFQHWGQFWLRLTVRGLKVNFWFYFDSSDSLMNANGTKSHIEQLDFADESDQCLTHINHYIEEKTHIENFLQPNDITSKLEQLCVVEAHFREQWVCKVHMLLNQSLDSKKKWNIVWNIFLGKTIWKKSN